MKTPLSKQSQRSNPGKPNQR